MRLTPQQVDVLRGLVVDAVEGELSCTRLMKDLVDEQAGSPYGPQVPLGSRLRPTSVGQIDAQAQARRMYGAITQSLWNHRAYIRR